MTEQNRFSPGQRALLRQKIHVVPGALAQSSGDIRQELDSGWNGSTQLVQDLAGLPDAALTWWAAQPRGHILLTAHSDAYEPARLKSDQRHLEGVAQISLSTLVRDPHQAACLALHPLDHLLGCGGAPQGAWLSDGGGINPRWRTVGEQVVKLFDLGYGLSPRARQDPHFYLAEGLVLAMQEKRRLNTADPKLQRLLKASLLNDGFWHNFIANR